MKRTVLEGVNLAFSELSEFTKQIKLKKNESNFDFATGSAVTNTVEIIINGFVFTTKKESSTRENTANSNTRVIVKTVEVQDINHYDVVEIEGIEYKIGGVISKNDFIITFYYYE